MARYYQLERIRYGGLSRLRRKDNAQAFLNDLRELTGRLPAFVRWWFSSPRMPVKNTPSINLAPRPAIEPHMAARHLGRDTDEERRNPSIDPRRSAQRATQLVREGS